MGLQAWQRPPQRPNARSILTGSDNVTLIETIPTDRLITSWRCEFSIDITNELHGVTHIVKYRCNDTGLICFAPTSVAGSAWLYEQLSRIPWYYQKDKWEFRIARRELRKCRAIFEVGCGTGEFLKILGEDGHEVAGSELNSEAVEQARLAGVNASDRSLIEVSAAHRERFDAVCSFQVLEHLPEPAALINAMIELVKPGGKIAFAVPNSAGFEGLGYDLLQYPPHHMSWWTADCFRSLPSLFRVRVDKIIAEPLAEEQIHNYLMWYMRHFRDRSPHYRWIFNTKTLPVFRWFLSVGLRRLLSGHALYAQFVKL